MFNNDNELLPRTYSIKSYRVRKTVGAKSIARFLLYIALGLTALGAAVLALINLV